MTMTFLRYDQICVLVAVAILEEILWYLQICNSCFLVAHGPLVFMPLPAFDRSEAYSVRRDVTSVRAYVRVCHVRNQIQVYLQV